LRPRELAVVPDTAKLKPHHVGHFCRRIPIYLGAPNAAAYAPPGSFVNALEYTPKQLAQLIKQLDADDEAYNAYFGWWIGGKDGLLQRFSHLLGDNLLFGPKREGLEWVCRLCQLYHKYYDWQPQSSSL
jgi:hypothetical protein